MTAIAIGLHEHPQRIVDLTERLDIASLTGITRKVADLVDQFPALAETCAGELADLAAALRDDALTRGMLWLEIMPESEKATLPTFDLALAVISPQREKLEPVGYLARWKSDLRSRVDGQRAKSPSTWKYDHLWRAACHEAAALEYERAGFHAAADDSMRRAAREWMNRPSATQEAA
jgi:hypothetical protein